MASRSVTTLLLPQVLLRTCKSVGVNCSLALKSRTVLPFSHQLSHFFHSNGCFRPVQPLTQRLCCAGRICRTGANAGECLSSYRVFPSSAQPALSWCVVRSYAKKAKSKKEKVVKGGKKKVALSAEELDGVLDLGKLQDEMTLVSEDLKQQMIQQVSVYDNLPVKTEDGVFPLIQLGQVVQKNPTLILVNMAAAPQYLTAVKEALSQSGLNINPQQDGTTLFIPVPKITREHREGLAKNAKTLHDKAKTRLRDIHNKYVKKVKAAKDHHSEDIIRAAQDLVLDEMHGYGQQLDAMLAAKQQELLGGK